MTDEELRMQRLEEMAQHAVSVVTLLPPTKHRYPEVLICAQWALESNWGRKPSGKNNPFGMTYVEGLHRSFSWVKTSEVLSDKGIASLPACERATIAEKVKRPDGRWNVKLSRRFADYASIDEAIADKVRLITTSHYYAAGWAKYQETGVLMDLLSDMTEYATGDDYITKVYGISQQRNIQTAVKRQRAAMAKSA